VLGFLADRTTIATVATGSRVERFEWRCYNLVLLFSVALYRQLFDIIVFTIFIYK
jgi:hypothetical protein